jgi:trans-aconitate methyltransferase
MAIIYPNAYFRITDPHPQQRGDFEIPEGWWSRRYEYEFAMQYAATNQVVADMGCGWHYRPLHDELTTICKFVYGVDHHVEVLDLPAMSNGAFVVADFSKPITEIPAASLDRIFCISVLEELINYQDALAEFKRLLKDDGLIVLTCDVPHDDTKPAHEKYKGVRLDDLERAILATGLHYTGSVNRVKYDDLLHHNDFNLCVWHCVLKKA